MLSVKCESDYNAIKGIWTSLWMCNSRSCVYQSPDYVELLWNHLLPYRFILQVRPQFFIFYENDVPIMILPLFYRYGRKEACLFGYKAGCGYLDIVCLPEVSVHQIDACISMLKCEYHIEKLIFSHVRRETILGEYLLSKGGEINPEPCLEIPVFDEYENYYHSLSKNTRQNIRTAYNRLQKNGSSITVERYTAREMPNSLRKRVLDLYLQRQKEHYKRAGGLFLSAFVKHIDMGTIAEKYLFGEDVFILKIDGKVAAYMDAMHSRETLVVPRLAIDSTYNPYSPGVLLINETLKVLIEEGKFRWLDLTHGGEMYKRAMGGQETRCVDAVLSLL